MRTIRLKVTKQDFKNHIYPIIRRTRKSYPDLCVSVRIRQLKKLSKKFKNKQSRTEFEERVVQWHNKFNKSKDWAHFEAIMDLKNFGIPRGEILRFFNCMVPIYRGYVQQNSEQGKWANKFRTLERNIRKRFSKEESDIILGHVPHQYQPVPQNILNEKPHVQNEMTQINDDDINLKKPNLNESEQQNRQNDNQEEEKTNPYETQKSHPYLNNTESFNGFNSKHDFSQDNESIPPQDFNDVQFDNDNHQLNAVYDNQVQEGNNEDLIDFQIQRNDYFPAMQGELAQHPEQQNDENQDDPCDRFLNFLLNNDD